MTKKKKGIKPGDLIIFGIVLLFGYFPLGIIVIILGIIWAMVENNKKTSDNKIFSKSQPLSVEMLSQDTNIYDKVSTQSYMPPIQEKVADDGYIATDTYDTNAKYETSQMESKEYVYTVSHTENDARDRRTKTFTGIISQHTDNVGEAIGLLRLSHKLAGVKNVVIDVSVDKNAEIMGIREKDGHIRVKTTSVKQAIAFLRRAYAQWGLKGITLHIYLKNTDTPKVETLLEIAKSTYRASEGQGGEGHVLAI